MSQHKMDPFVGTGTHMVMTAKGLMPQAYVEAMVDAQNRELDRYAEQLTSQDDSTQTGHYVHA